MRFQWCNSSEFMFKEFLILLTLIHADSTYGEMTGFVFGGTYTDIKNYPHSVFLDLSSKVNCICGGSILTQDIVLSAAHCFDEYLGRRKDTVIIKYGGTALAQMSQTRVRYYRLHDYYNEETMYGDIALLLCAAPIKLGNTVKRVAIMIKPPTEKLAYVSGWGSIDDNQRLPKYIKFTKQELQPLSKCGKYLSLPAGTFCAGPVHGPGHPGSGDSGGALMIKQFIQIGIVSFKEEVSDLVVYTNTSYYYNWIRENAANTYCAKF